MHFARGPPHPFTLVLTLAGSCICIAFSSGSNFNSLSLGPCSLGSLGHLRSVHHPWLSVFSYPNPQTMCPRGFQLGLMLAGIQRLSLQDTAKEHLSSRFSLKGWMDFPQSGTYDTAGEVRVGVENQPAATRGRTEI